MFFNMLKNSVKKHCYSTYPSLLRHRHFFHLILFGEVCVPTSRFLVSILATYGLTSALALMRSQTFDSVDLLFFVDDGVMSAEFFLQLLRRIVALPRRFLVNSILLRCLEVRTTRSRRCRAHCRLLAPEINLIFGREKLLRPSNSRPTQSRFIQIQPEVGTCSIRKEQARANICRFH